jgi:radical SAM superfamily enzyme YgiQ (UPF0313 family)
MDVILFGNFFEGFLKSSSLMQLSYQLRKQGISVRQIHHFLSFNKEQINSILNKFKSEGGKVVCLSTSFLSTTHETEDRFIKKIETPMDYWGKYKTAEGEVDVFASIAHLVYTAKNYGLKVLIGGWEVQTNTYMRKKTGFSMLSQYVDAYVIGDGIEAIKSFLYGNQTNDKLILASAITDYTDMSSAPIVEDNIYHKEPLFLSIASGCVFSCHFCNFGSLGKKKYEYMRSYESLKREIISNYENFGTTMYHLTDNIMNDYDEKMNYLIRIKDETGIDVKWAGYVRLDTIKNRHQADLLRDSGMVGALMGIESFTASAGRYVGKMTDGEKLKDILRMCRESWKNTALISASMIAGLPTETPEQVRKTYEYLISDEGRYLVDSHKFHILHINLENDDKNEINKHRNSPFRDYIIDGYRWTSPWGSSTEFNDLVRSMRPFNAKRKNVIHAQNLINYVNLGFNVDDVVKSVRQRKPLSNNYETLLFQKVEEYKNKVLL